MAVQIPEGLEKFEEIWQRVQQWRQTPLQPKEHGVEAVMERLHYLRCGYRQLVSCTRDMEKKRLTVLSKQTEEHFRLLQRYYFLKEGDIYSASAAPNFASYTPYNLRKLWQSTVENAEWLENCNLNGEVHFVAESDRMKAETEWQKNELEALIGRLLQ